MKIGLECEGDVMIITNNFSKTDNALNADFYAVFANALAKANEDPTISAIMLTAGGWFFFNGGDLNRLKKFATTSEPERRDPINWLHAMIKDMTECPKPIIAAVEGDCGRSGRFRSGGLDSIVMAENANFSVTYVKIGLSPDGGAAGLLAQALPR